jgi:predicted RNA-binding Zn ribbon-like protein
MVTLTGSLARSPWTDGHFIGGHPVMDLANTVFDRLHPIEDGELLKTPVDVLTWCASVGLVEFDEVSPLVEASASGLVPEVQAVREEVWAVFNAVALGEAVPAEPFAALLERAGMGVRAERVRQIGPALDCLSADWTAPGAIPAVLSLLAVRALFALPAERVRACGRCGWLFLDSSRGGRRRWCSMSTCGNREKASRHRKGRLAVG